MTKVVSVDIRTARLSGMGTYLTNVLPRIIKLSPHIKFILLGHQHDVGALGVSDLANIDFINATSRIYSAREQLDLLRLIPRDTDAFWSPHFNIPLGYRGKLLVTVHDMFHLAMPEFVGGYHKKLYARMIFSAVGRKASAILTDSAFTGAELTRFIKKHPPIHPIHLGVDKAWFDPPITPRPHPRPYILFVGNVKPHKNIRGLVEAFALAPRAPYDLIIVGRKEGFITADTGVAEQAQALGERVVFTGWLTDSELKQYVFHASALALPSFYEGFGLPPLEAMACGTPVIVSHAASLPEVCGDAALYCDPHSPQDIADKIQRLMRDETLRETLRHEGLARARTFSWDQCAQETLVVLEQVLAS